MMIDTQKNIFRIMTSTNTNRFLYYFKRIPLIGKLLPDRLYGDLPLKKDLAVIAAILNFFGKILGKAFFVGLFVALPAVLMTKDAHQLLFTSYLHIFAVVSFFGSLLVSQVFTGDRDEYLCVRLMHMDAKEYIVSTTLFREVTDFIYFLPVMLFATILMGGTPVQAILLTVLRAGLSLIGEGFFLLLYTRAGVMPSGKGAYLVAAGTLCLAAAYLPPLLHRPIVPCGLLFHPAFLLPLSALAAVCVFFLVTYRRYHEIALATLKSSSFSEDPGKLMAEAKFADVQVREKDFRDAELKLHKFDDKEGFAYLNAIFFDRHRRLFVRPILIRLAIIAIVSAGAVVVSFLSPHLFESVRPGVILPAFVFILYLVSIGERVCKAMFYNCDISLLRYSFYREKGAVLSNFKVRLFRVAGLNLIVAAAICVATVGLASFFRMGWPVPETVSFVLSIVFLSLFFSVHHLFLYYVFQPYTTESGVKNPFYSIINNGVYLLCFSCIKIKSPPSYFALIVLAATFLYIVVALILVDRLAPKTFRVK